MYGVINVQINPICNFTGLFDIKNNTKLSSPAKVRDR